MIKLRQVAIKTAVLEVPVAPVNHPAKRHGVYEGYYTSGSIDRDRDRVPRLILIKVTIERDVIGTSSGLTFLCFLVDLPGCRKW